MKRTQVQFSETSNSPGPGNLTSCPHAYTQVKAKLSMAAHAFNSSSRRAKAGRSLLTPGQPGLHTETVFKKSFQIQMPMGARAAGPCGASSRMITSCLCGLGDKPGPLPNLLSLGLAFMCSCDILAEDDLSDLLPPPREHWDL